MRFAQWPRARIASLEPLPNQRFIAFDRSMQWLLAGNADLRQQPANGIGGQRERQGHSGRYYANREIVPRRPEAELLSRYMANLIAAAGRSGARLVVLDNVYMLGRPQGKPLDE
jgi:hypothetical protein